MVPGEAYHLKKEKTNKKSLIAFFVPKLSLDFPFQFIDTAFFLKNHGTEQDCQIIESFICSLLRPKPSFSRQIRTTELILDKVQPFTFCLFSDKKSIYCGLGQN